MPDIPFHNGSCHYTKRGCGPALLLVHGLGSSAKDWQDQVSSLSGTYTTLAVDLAGHGQSSPVSEPVEIPLLAEQLLAILNAENISRAHIVGLSLGGAVALQLALDAPERVASLTLANSRVCFRPQNFRDRLQAWQRLWLVRLLGPAALSRLLAKRLFPDSATLRARFVGSSKQIDPNVYLSTLKALLRWDVRQRLDEIRCPTLIIAAEYDYLPITEARAICSSIRDAKFTLINKAHHAVSVEYPKEFNRAIRSFLQQLPEHYANALD